MDSEHDCWGVILDRSKREIAMSVADHEVEPVDEYEGWCEDHQIYYRREQRCRGCVSDAADRQHDSQREERGRA